MTESSRTRPLHILSVLLSDRTLTKRAYLNAVASMLEYGATLAVGFLVTPFMVFGLGDYAYGLWQVLNRLVGYLTPASGRPSYALKWTLANQQASEDLDRKRRYVGSTLIVWGIFLPVLMALGSIVAWYVPSWIQAPAEWTWVVRVVSLLLVGNIITESIASTPQAVLQGENMGYKRMGLSAGMVLFRGGLTWAALFFKTGIIGVGVSVVLGTILNGLFFLLIVPHYATWFGTARPHKEELREMLGRSWWFLAWNLVTSLLFASDVVVLGIFNSVVSVTNYSLTKYVPEMMISVIANIVFAIMPGMGGIIGSGDTSRAIRLRDELLSIVWLVVTAAGAVILLWNSSFLTLWVGAGRYSGSFAHLLIVVGVMQLVFIRSDATIIDVTLRLSEKVLLGLLSVTISIVSASVLVGYFKMGIVGLCAGTIFGRLILTVGYPMLVGRFLSLPAGDQLKGLIRPSVVTIFLFAGAYAIDQLMPVASWPVAHTWLGFFILAGLSAVASLVMAFYAGLTRRERSSILQRIRMTYAEH